jgi:hypothetical protein
MVNLLGVTYFNVVSGCFSAFDAMHNNAIWKYCQPLFVAMHKNSDTPAVPQASLPLTAVQA